jgi:hypothetical protein
MPGNFASARRTFLLFFFARLSLRYTANTLKRIIKKANASVFYLLSWLPIILFGLKFIVYLNALNKLE